VYWAGVTGKSVACGSNWSNSDQDGTVVLLAGFSGCSGTSSDCGGNVYGKHWANPCPYVVWTSIRRLPSATQRAGGNCTNRDTTQFAATRAPVKASEKLPNWLIPCAANATPITIRFCMSLTIHCRKSLRTKHGAEHVAYSGARPLSTSNRQADAEPGKQFNAVDSVDRSDPTGNTTGSRGKTHGHTLAVRSSNKEEANLFPRPRRDSPLPPRAVISGTSLAPSTSSFNALAAAAGRPPLQHPHPIHRLQRPFDNK
jgi:hypothetical protein